jgi:hypothetical protein
MRTDELRNELHDLASELEPFEGDARRVRGRVRGRRAAFVGALVIALAIPAVTFALRDRSDRVTVAAPKEVSVDELTSRDALIVVEDDAALASVRTALDSSDLVDGYSELSPRVGSSLQPLDLWPSSDRCDAGGFVVDLRAGRADVERLRQVLERDAAVHDWRDVTADASGRWGDDFDIEIFMTVDATTEQVDAVARALDRATGIDRVEYLSKQDAYEEFRRIFSDQPDLIATTSAENLPESFRVALEDGASVTDLTAQLNAEPGVDDVLTPSAGWVGDRGAFVDRVLRGDYVGDMPPVCPSDSP